MIRLIDAPRALARCEELATMRQADFRRNSASLTIDRPPTAASLEAALMCGVPAFVAIVDEEPAGYGFVRRWTESGNLAVQLLDVWAAPGAARTAVEEALFSVLEDAVRPEDGILGANYIAGEEERRELLEHRGFKDALDMVELCAPRVLSTRYVAPADSAIRTAEHDDADQIAALTARAWTGRPFFTGAPSTDEVRGWLASSETDLYLLAVHGSSVIGLASAKTDDGFVEIDDVQVDPDWQRRGVATALVTSLFDRVRERSDLPIRLHTEGHDPAGALALYERLGFRVTARHHRMRKLALAVSP